MYIALCDDNADELRKIEELLEHWRKERNVPLRFKSFDNADEFICAAKRESFTLYMLDIVMLGTNGIAAAKEIRTFDDATEIIFFTSSADYAYESYQVRAMDYLLKPVSPEKLFSILDTLLLREQKPKEGITVKSGQTLIRILFSQLSFVEVSGKHIYFNMSDGSVREIFGALNVYEPLLLEREEFIRIHRSYIVNMMHISELSPAGVRMFSGLLLPVSRRLYQVIQ